MYHKLNMPNGLRVVTEYLPHIHSVSVGVWIKAGSRQETPINTGVAHCIEHMLFKGTSTRSAKKIAEEIEAVGGQLNAFTSKEYTCYYARVLDTDFPLACTLLADILLNSRLDSSEIDKEKGVILEEIKMCDDNPEDLAHDLLAGIMLPDHPLGKPILGNEETVRKIKRRDLARFMQDYYQPDNTVIAVAGNIKPETVFSETERNFGSWIGRTRVLPDLVPGITGHSYARQKDVEQVHLCIGFPGVCREDDRRYTLAVLDLLLGGGVSSRLFQELREERGLVYSTYSSHSAYRECGIFSIYAGTSASNLNQVLDLIRRNLRDVIRDPVGGDEIQRGKQQLRANLLLSMESTSTRMHRLAKNELFYGRHISLEEIVDKINGISERDIAVLASANFKENNLNTVILGPVS
ncbi:MAG: M16 family metallopeptidase [Bacillota bacterium]